VSHFIYSNNFVSRKNEKIFFDTQPYFECTFIQNYFDRQDTTQTNIIYKKRYLSMEEERIQFPKGKQKEFIKITQKKSNLTWKQFAKVLGFKYNKLQNLWKENYRLSKNDFEIICNSLKIDPNFLLKQFNGEKVFWNNLIALSKIKNKKFLGKAINKPKKINIKYKNTNLLLDISSIDNNPNKLFSNIRLPKIICEELAYETGTSIGDGCIPTRGKSYRSKGNKNDEKEYYQNIIKPMFKELYNIDINLKEYTKAFGFECYSSKLIEFKNKVIGLPIGPKKNIRIPNCFKVNDSKILSSLISGLFDTDGTICFRSQNKNKYYYPTIRFTTISKPLSEDVQETLKMLGFKTYLYTNNKINVRNPSPKFEVILYGYENFKKYLELIGTKQQKNINKINKWRKDWPSLAKMADIY
jgi:transcriptional regulator with XRE-family HTH domain